MQLATLVKIKIAGAGVVHFFGIGRAHLKISVAADGQIGAGVSGFKGALRKIPHEARHVDAASHLCGAGSAEAFLINEILKVHAL